MLLGNFKKKKKLCCKQCMNFANKETSCSTTTKKKKTCTTRQKQHKLKKRITKANEIDSMLVSPNKNKRNTKVMTFAMSNKRKKEKDVIN